MTSDRSERRESLSGRAFNIKNHDYRKKGDHFSKGSEDNEIVKDIAYGGSVVNINGAKKWREGWDSRGADGRIRNDQGQKCVVRAHGQDHPHPHPPNNYPRMCTSVSDEG